MKKTIFAIGILFLITVNLFAQSQIDSLVKVSEKATEEQKIQPLLELADIYRNINLDTSLLYATQVLDLAKKFNDAENTGQALKKIGLVYYYAGMVDSAMALFTRSMGYFKKSNNISEQANLLNNLGILISDKGDYNKALENYEFSKKLYLSINDSVGVSGVLGNIGSIYLNVASYEKALEYFQQANQMAKESGDEFTVMSSTNNIGMVYHYWGKYEEAIKYYQRSLDYSEEQNDRRTAAMINMNIGIIYFDWGKYERALSFYKKSVKIQTDLNDLNNLISTYNNIAIIYENLDSLDLALNYYKMALDISKEIENMKGVGVAYFNIATFYMAKEEYFRAREYYEKSLNVRREIGDNLGVGTSLLSIGQSYFYQKQARKSISYYNKSLKILEPLGVLEKLIENYAALAEAYRDLGNYQKSVFYMERYSKTKDSLFTENTFKQIEEIQTKYETEKKEKEIELLNKENLVKDLKVKEQHEAIQKQRIAIISFIVVFALIIVFSIIVYRLYNKIKNANEQLALQNAEINEQKEEIMAQNDEIFAKNEVLEQQNEEITSQRDEIEAQRDLVINQKAQIELILEELSQSIDYAKQIQTSILPEKSILDENNIESFTIFKPKDRVSGDFYWWASVEEYTVIAVSDCTGHGVPGAFMSFLGISFLREIVTKEYITHPGVILRKLRVDIIKTLAQTGEEGTHKDGMDMSILVINHKDNTVSWAGANNPLWIVRAKRNEEVNDLAENIEEIKADKMPVGIYMRMDKFTNHEVNLETGDRIFMFSDGFPDQFGGPKGKKYKSRAFKRLIAKTSDLSIEEQGKHIEMELSEWMRWEGNIYNQVDDITVFGAIVKE
jgi:tetratricopeptide (TPR) repeat protein/serine phosphatase RsbU (regulator of sigma subunit)